MEVTGLEPLIIQQVSLGWFPWWGLQGSQEQQEKAGTDAQALFKSLGSLQISHFLVSLANAGHMSKPRANKTGTTQGYGFREKKKMLLLFL